MRVTYYCLALAWLGMIGCSRKDDRLITNDSGKYSLKVPPGWDYQFEELNTRVSKSRYYGEIYVTGTLVVYVMDSKYETLEESVDFYVGSLKYSFKDYQKVSEGRTQINNIEASWHRMKDTDNGVRFITLQYLMQPVGRKMFVINCSATEDTFSDFEEEFNRIAFSFTNLR